MENENKNKVEFNVKKEQIEGENYNVDITLKEFIESIKTNVYEFDLKNRDIDTLALITFRESRHTMDGILNKDSHDIRKGCSNSIVCNIALLLRCNISIEEIIKKIMSAVEKQCRKIHKLQEKNYGNICYFWKADSNTLTIRELMTEIKNNTYSFDSIRTLVSLALVVFRQEAKTMKGIDEDIDYMITGDTNTIVCNISLLIKNYLEDRENQKKLENDEMIKRLLRAINQQASQIKSYEKSKRFYK